MNSLFEIKAQFESGQIEKRQFIEKMYGLHFTLFDYAEFINNTDISKIEITDSQIIMTFRDSGLKFICIKNDLRLAPIEALNFGSYEKEELEMQLNLIEENDNILDIGANLGWYAMHIAKKKPNARVFSFEPIPVLFEGLNKNIEINKLINIETHNFGLSEGRGSFDFYFDPTLSVNASLLNVSDKSQIESIKCYVRELDDYIEEKKFKVGFIKCDVEGAELLVFRGGIKLIERDTPIVFTEMLRKYASKFGYHPNDIISFYHQRGYLCFISKNKKLLRFDSVDENTTETNYFFLHRDKHAEQIMRLGNI